MEPLKPPKDVLGLGRHLVRELGLEDGVDTLGRWMAHYLAELIDEAANGSTAAKRTKARKEAVAAILKIWHHRTSLLGKAYPLAPYRDVLKGMARLQPGSGLFGYFGHYAENKRDQLAAGLFNNFSRLNIALLLMKIPSSKRSAEMDSTAMEALSDTEKQVFLMLQEWEKFFEPASKDSRPGRKSKRSTGRAKVDLNEIVIQLVDTLTTTLAELRNELQETAQQNASTE